MLAEIQRTVERWQGPRWAAENPGTQWTEEELELVEEIQERIRAIPRGQYSRLATTTARAEPAHGRYEPAMPYANGQAPGILEQLRDAQRQDPAQLRAGQPEGSGQLRASQHRSSIQQHQAGQGHELP